ncbi:hypothetical protein Tco_0877116 [Tanacetum coccineum]|uniref:Uncharacterized protein n=1 Tax=Tanacetum coccineum TaxID=301880 RepID=A0ABQ5BU80_9ASTR
MERMERETMARLEVSNAKKRNENLNMLALDTTWMHSAFAAKIEELKDELRVMIYYHSITALHQELADLIFIKYWGSGRVVNLYLKVTLAVYNPCSQQIHNLEICGENGIFDMGSYKESLLLLDHSDSRIYCDDTDEIDDKTNEIDEDEIDEDTDEIDDNRISMGLFYEVYAISNMCIVERKSMCLTEAVEEEAARQVHATHERIMIESDPEPARKRPSGIAFRDTSGVSKNTSLDLLQKLKGVHTLTPEEQLAADTMQSLKASRKSIRSHLHAGGSSEGTDTKPGVPDESTVTPTTSSEGIGTKPRVPDEEKDTSAAKVDVTLDWGSENENDDDLDDDKNIDLEKTNDEEADDEFVHSEEYVQDDDEETDDEFVHGDEQVNDDEN